MLYSPLSGKAVKTRWTHGLLSTYVPAFVASRVIGVFEHTISQLVALANFVPIVAGIGEIPVTKPLL